MPRMRINMSHIGLVRVVSARHQFARVARGDLFGKNMRICYIYAAIKLSSSAINIVTLI